VLIFTLVVIGLLFVVHVPIVGKPVVHPEFGTMLHSSPEIGPNSTFRLLSALLGILILCHFILFLFIGLDNRSTGASKNAKFGIWIGGLLYVAVFVLLLLVHWDYNENVRVTFFGGFPLPTAIMLYVLITTPVYFTILYILRFNQWILSPGDLVKFRHILEERRKIEMDLKNNPG
jgi:hypothetical protein